MCRILDLVLINFVTLSHFHSFTPLQAIDHPSPACTHLMGKTADGKQLGHAGYGLSVGSFATQTETMEIHVPELIIARTAVLDYFSSPCQQKLKKIFDWERSFMRSPTRNLIKYVRSIAKESAKNTTGTQMGDNAGDFQYLLDGLPTQSEVIYDYPEFSCYRDISFYFKYWLNPSITAFPNNLVSCGTSKPREWSRLDAQLHWSWNQQRGEYNITSNWQGQHCYCAPDPSKFAKPGNNKKKQKKKIDKASSDTVPELPPLPTHRWPSEAEPSYYVPGLPIRNEDDVIYRPNLPTFGDEEADATDIENHPLGRVVRIIVVYCS